MRSNDIDEVSRRVSQCQAEAWFNSLPEVPSSEKPRIENLISEAVAELRSEYARRAMSAQVQQFIRQLESQKADRPTPTQPTASGYQIPPAGGELLERALVNSEQTLVISRGEEPYVAEYHMPMAPQRCPVLSPKDAVSHKSHKRHLLVAACIVTIAAAGILRLHPGLLGSPSSPSTQSVSALLSQEEPSAQLPGTSAASTTSQEEPSVPPPTLANAFVVRLLPNTMVDPYTDPNRRDEGSKPAPPDPEEYNSFVALPSHVSARGGARPTPTAGEKALLDAPSGQSELVPVWMFAGTQFDRFYDSEGKPKEKPQAIQVYFDPHQIADQTLNEKWLVGKKLVTTRDSVLLRKNKSLANENAVRQLTRGEILTITEEPVLADGLYWVGVDDGGDKRYVSTAFLRPVPAGE